MAVVSPASDVEEVRAAFRLGWALSELRGRYRPDRFHEPVPVAAEHFDFDRPVHELPLTIERSPDEVRIETLKAVQGLIGLLGLTDNTSLSSALTTVTEAACRLNKDRADVSADWPAFANKVYRLDAQLQDALVVRGSQAAAYQLGRGLADSYWTLYPERSQDKMGSWSNVLGPERSKALVRQALRLSPETGPLVLAATTGPLEQWRQLAGDDARREGTGVIMALYQQGLLWRDLIRGERQPSDLTQPQARHVWSDLRLYRSALGALRVPIAFALFAAAVLALGAALLASGKANRGLSTAISVLGALGITSAGLYARAKAELTALLATLRQTLQLERVRRAANLCPQPPSKKAKRQGTRSG